MTAGHFTRRHYRETLHCSYTATTTDTSPQDIARQFAAIGTSPCGGQFLKLKFIRCSGLLDVLENAAEDTPDQTLLTDSLRKEVKRALSTLTQREADVISLYFGLNGEHAMTLEEIFVAEVHASREGEAA